MSGRFAQPCRGRGWRTPVPSPRPPCDRLLLSDRAAGSAGSPSMVGSSASASSRDMSSSASSSPFRTSRPRRRCSSFSDPSLSEMCCSSPSANRNSDCSGWRRSWLAEARNLVFASMAFSAHSLASRSSKALCWNVWTAWAIRPISSSRCRLGTTISISPAANSDMTSVIRVIGAVMPRKMYTVPQTTRTRTNTPLPTRNIASCSTTFIVGRRSKPTRSVPRFCRRPCLSGWLISMISVNRAFSGTAPVSGFIVKKSSPRVP